MTRTPARIIATALLAGAAAALPATAVAGQPKAKARGKPTQDVLVVSNNWAGTADVIALKGFKRLARINVIPTRPSAWPRSTPTRGARPSST